MLYLNDVKIEPTTFPDGTSSIKIDPSIINFNRFSTNNIIWHYENDGECMLLWYLVSHIRNKISNARITLDLPYIPNARMDRVKNPDEVFTLKWFANFINTLNFESVGVCDPHSNVAMSLIDRVVDYKGEIIPIVEELIDYLTEEAEAESKEFIICYPDEGSCKRYSEMFSHDYVFCIKHRDWRTGNIQGLELTNPEKVKGKFVLIVDDICSKGGTFTHTAKTLKDAGAEKVYLYVTHCEDTIYKGSILTDGLIDCVWTTNSIFNKEDDYIGVYKLFEEGDE